MTHTIMELLKQKNTAQETGNAIKETPLTIMTPIVSKNQVRAPLIILCV